MSAAKAMIVRERKRRLELEARKTSSAETEAEDRRKLEAYVPPPALRNENFRITAADLQEFNALNKDLDFIFTSKMYLE